MTAIAPHDAAVSTAKASRLPPDAEGFLTWLAVERGRAATTLEAYRRDLQLYADWIDDHDGDLATVSADDIARYVVDLRGAGLAPATVARATVVARSLHRFLVAEGSRIDDPGGRVASPTVPAALPKALTEDQVARLLASVTGDDAVALRDGALLEVLYGSGVRISEAVGLSLADVDLDARLLRVFGKGAKERIVPLGSHGVRALARWYDDGRPELSPTRWRRRTDSEAVFLNQRGGRLTRQGGWLILSGHAQRVDLADVVSPHVLRHSCATHMLDHGADIRAVQEMLGHASISTTQGYTKVATERLWAVYREAHPRARRGGGS